ncbi:MAG: hypothetical protein QNK90_16945 [Opitutaceae bacterium]
MAVQWGFESIDTWWWWAQCATTWALVGLMWVVQVVIYPQMARMVPEGFASWHHAYAGRISRVVVPLMGAEAILVAVWVYASPTILMGWISAVLVLIIWLSTICIQIPLHRRLASGWNVATIERLVATNWIRTLAWTLRGGIVLAATIIG